VEGTAHRRVVGETNGGDVLLLDDLWTNVGGCDVGKGKSFRVSDGVTASSDHAPATVMARGGACSDR
jgi:hypothetical protein